jgi:UDP-3-O-[3-hydroxymyristoyl] N-acetylglucosamine deacetylase/3-hydroxyacyl-[acyl-carrier-protein] dehydratase
MQLLYELDYGNGGPIGRQFRHFDFSNGDYAHEIAPSRTFVLASEAAALQQNGMGKHLTPDDLLVIGPEGPLGSNRFRFQDEPVRHKMLDLIGDLYLLGAPIQGRIVAYKSGHALNHQLVRHLIRQYEGHSRRALARDRTAIDIRQLTRFLPHRYPMLLVDRVVEIDGDRRAVGIKNVTMNEPFFQGHYPGTPIMPGVLIVEAMAQLSGVLIAQKLEHTGKLAVLLSLDRVKLRRPVTPGDQLVMEAESVKVRSRIAHMRCRAYVAEELAAEAEVKFMLVDDDQE